jgi:hypothetical protein
MNENFDHQAETIGDLFKSISKEQIAQVVEKNISNRIGIGDKKDELVASIEGDLDSNKSAVMLTEMEFNILVELLESVFPEGQLDINVIDGGEGLMRTHEDISKNASINFLYQKMLKKVPESGFPAHRLGEIYRNDELKPREKILFVRNYNNFTIDVRHEIHYLIARGIKLFIERATEDKMPYNGFPDSQNDFVVSSYLRSQSTEKSHLRFADSEEKSDERIA